MSDEIHIDPRRTIEMPRPTAAPIVLAAGLSLCAAGWAMGLALLAVGVVLVVAALAIWITQLFPAQGHVAEPIAEPARARPAVVFRKVEPLVAGRPGYRLRLPERVHPISAGIKGGIVGGLAMPIPALAYGLLSEHGIWYVVNLLAGMVLPGMGQMSVEQLEHFRPHLLIMAMIIHAVMSVMLGTIYGVLMPTLPEIPKPISWGALLMPLLWTAVTYSSMALVNPVLRDGVDWPWFVVSQFVFGLIAALVVMRFSKSGPLVAGLLGGVAGGILMALPASGWSLLTHHGLWYPVNLLAGMLRPGMDRLPASELVQFRAEWFIRALAIHAAMCMLFGVIYAALLPRLPAILAPLAWGGLVMPLLWTAASYSLMGVVNPVLQERVDWPWFIASQFVFGIVAAIVIVRSETVRIPPAGAGPDSLSTFIEGSRV